MSPDLLFSLVFPLAAPFWALMILAPGWSVTRRVVASPWIVAPALVCYAVAVLPNVATALPVVAAPTLAGIGTFLATPVGTAAGWAHFIGFDLFVGRWAYLDAREREIHPFVMAPVLLLTILFAPLGLLAYLVVRTAVRRRVPA